MKSVMISIQPKWCELICSGKKTVEVRKTKPKLETPFKCYIYATWNGRKKEILVKQDGQLFCEDWRKASGLQRASGKVIGEFVCKAILPISITYSDPNSKVALREFPFTCLTDKEIIDYLGNGKTGYGWHISNLVIYDKPRELGEFSRKCEKTPCEGCEHLKYQGVNSAEYDYDCEFLGNRIPITRPPQSWCYVESEDKK